jgi:hypothetical protein
VPSFVVTFDIGLDLLIRIRQQLAAEEVLEFGTLLAAGWDH